MELSHLCHTPNCVNPDHLEQVPPAVNVRQSAIDGRFSASRKLVMADVERIRTDPRRQIDIAKDFGISQSHVSNIKRGGVWL